MFSKSGHAVVAAVLLAFSGISSAAVLASDFFETSADYARPAGAVFAAGGFGNVGGLQSPISFSTAGGPVTIAITDCCTVGDVFEAIVDGVFVGRTAEVPLGGSVHSLGEFVVNLGAGEHFLQLWDITLSYLGFQAPFGPVSTIVPEDYSPAGGSYLITGAAPVSITSVPVSGVLGLFGLGVALLSARRFRR